MTDDVPRFCNPRPHGRHAVDRGYEQTTRALNEERAAALRRIAGTLESLLDRLHAERARIVTVPDAERPPALADYDELRRKAMQYRWFLEVQREALGLHDHSRLDEFYEVPDALE